MPNHPVDPAKIELPHLLPDTVGRPRLFELLDGMEKRRVIVVAADAGYGKTTLLADYARRRSASSAWLHLDRGDQDWGTFLAGIVAALLARVPALARVPELLTPAEAGARTFEAASAALFRALADGIPEPLLLVIDDIQMLEDAPESSRLLRELLVRAPRPLSFALVGRRAPSLGLARLRTAGDVGEVTTADLRFTSAETDAFLRTGPGSSLESEVITEVQSRTEGWAAPLRLVKAAMTEVGPDGVRSLITSFNGAEGHLYEYLAEEVIEEMSAELRHFLMATSLLETVDPALGATASDISEADSRRRIDEALGRGLVTRVGPIGEGHVRAHPLVREFLASRLTRTAGPGPVRRIHELVARAAEAVSWRTSVHHYIEGELPGEAQRVLAESIEAILATGAYTVAREYATKAGPGDGTRLVALVLDSRLALQRGDAAEALRLAEEAVASGDQRTIAALNLITARNLAGDIVGAMEVARLLEGAQSDIRSMVGLAYRQMIETSLDGSLDAARLATTRLVAALEPDGGLSFLGVAQSHLAYIERWRGDLTTSREFGERSVTSLMATDSGIELVSARLALAWTYAAMKLTAEAKAQSEQARRDAPPSLRIEVAYETADYETFFGDQDTAFHLLEDVESEIVGSTDTGEQGLVVRAFLRIREGDYEAARSDIASFSHDAPRSSVAFETRRLMTEAYLAVMTGDEGKAAARRATDAAVAQSAWLWRDVGLVLLATADPDAHLRSMAGVATRNPIALSMVAEAAMRVAHLLPDEAREALQDQARTRPVRWRAAVRDALGSSQPQLRSLAAELLSEIGTEPDVARLRELERGTKPRSGLARALSRRLAPRLWVEDLGRVRVSIGGREIDSTAIRRKVLALLCLLLSRPGLSASREEVIDALWPEYEPDLAANSLNQTVYFLRRVFETGYSEDRSPGYLRQDGELIWLDPELVGSRSTRCLELVRDAPSDPTGQLVRQLSSDYVDRFANEFMYEEWAAPFREFLHASYLRLIEGAIGDPTTPRAAQEAIVLAERAVRLDAAAESLNLALIRLYRATDAHAAAREQYERYARAVRELGLEVPAYSEI